MDAEGQVYVTKEGLEKLRTELKELKTVKRKEISLRIQEAKEFGDLSENAEYSEAKTEQGFTEGRIIEIENIIKNAMVIADEVAGGLVQVGSTVTVESDTGKRTYTIVGSNESDPTTGLISNESPLGQAFIGHKVGDEVEVKVPSGTATYRVLALK